MISDVYFPRVNGVSTSIQSFRNTLRADGHKVTLVVPAYPGTTDDDADVVRIRSRYLAVDPEDRIMRRTELLQFGRRLVAGDYDIVHIHTPFLAHHYGLWLARRLGVPVIETYHTHFEEYLYHYLPLVPKRLTRLVTRWFSRRQCNAVDALVVPSRAFEAVLQNYGVQKPLWRLPTGLELERIGPGSRRRFCARHGIDPNRPILVHIGRLAHEKNIGLILDALRRVRSIHPRVLLVIAGEGPARTSLVRRVRSMGLAANVRFLGYLKRGEPLWDCYCAGDLFVFASQTETQGLVLLEALALGVPVVSIAALGTHDILDLGRGAVVAENDPEDFASKVSSLLEQPERRYALGLQGQEFAAQWSAAALGKRLIDVYQATLGAGRAPDPLSAEVLRSNPPPA